MDKTRVSSFRNIVNVWDHFLILTLLSCVFNQRHVKFALSHVGRHRILSKIGDVKGVEDCAVKIFVIEVDGKRGGAKSKI